MHQLAAALGRTALPSLAALFVAACGAFEAPPPRPTPAPPASNVVANPGFELGADPWTALRNWQPFEVSEELAHGGVRSVRLRLGAPEGSNGSRIAGARQALFSASVPEYISGFYRVQDWDAGGALQYVALVIEVRGGAFLDGRPVHELRLAIAGAEQAVAEEAYIRYVYLDRDAPPTGEWTYFGYPVRQALRSRLGNVPDRVDGVSISLEVRREGASAEGTAGRADVYFDDLFAGPQPDNPNRPSGP